MGVSRVWMASLWVLVATAARAEPPVPARPAGPAGPLPVAVDTGFRPSVDLPNRVNRAGHGSAIHGKCNGIDELAQTYFRWRKQYPKAAGLAQQTAFMEASRGGKYVDGVLDLATQHSFATSKPTGNYANARATPDTFARDIVAALTRTGAPQSVIMGSRNGGVSHRVTIYGADPIQAADGTVRWSFRVADSNRIGAPGLDPDQVRLVYVPPARGQPGTWSETVGTQVLTRYDSGDLVRSAIPKASTYVDLVTDGLQGLPLGQIRAHLAIPEVPPPPVSLGPGSVEAVKDPAAGGVMVRFDPALFSGAIDDARLAVLESQYAAFLDDGTARAALFRLGPAESALAVVPIARVIDDPAGTVAGLTRIRGFVRGADGHIAIVGERAPGGEPVSRDVLVVALQAAYRQSATPFVSLDASPSDLAGPQRVRVGGLPTAAWSTAYVQAMLEADYLMKRINLGAVTPNVPGFASWLSLLEAGVAYTPGAFHRLWLAPLTAPIGELFEHRRAEAGGEALAVIFEGRVQVQSEAMRAETGALVAGGAPDAATEAAAGMFTRYFDALCAAYPEFMRLRAVFDATELAAALKAYGVTAPELDRLAALVPAKVAIPSTVPGIGPVSLRGSDRAVSGGVQAARRVTRRMAVATAALAPLLDAASAGAGDETVTVTLPGVLTLDATAAAGAEIETRVARASEALAAGAYDEAVQRAGEALALDPQHPEALAAKATALALMDRTTEALAAFDLLAETRPATRATTAIVRARTGDAAGARRDADRALAEAPDDDGVLAAVTQTRLFLVDLEGARTSLARLRARTPDSAVAVGLGLLLADLARRAPAERAPRVALLRQVPPLIDAAFAMALGNRAHPERAIGPIEDALAALESGAVTAPEGLFLAYRMRVGLLLAYAAQASAPSATPWDRDEATTRGAAIYARLVEARPASGLPHLLRAYLAVALDEPDANVLALLQQAAASPMEGDPFYADLHASFGARDLIDHLVVEAWARRTTPAAPRRTLLAFVAARTANRAERAFLEALASDDGSAALADIRDGVDALAPPAKQAALARFERLEKRLPRALAGTESFAPIAARIYAYIGILRLQLAQTTGGVVVMAKGVALLRMAAAHDPDPSPTATLIATLWLVAGLFDMQAIVEDLKAMDGAMTALEARFEVLASERPLPLAVARARLATINAEMAQATLRIAGFGKKRLAQTASRIGKLSNAALTLVLATLQAPGTATRKDPRATMQAANPELAATSEFTAFAAQFEALTAHAFVPASISEAWQALLATCEGAVDFVAAAELLRNLSDARKAGLGLGGPLTLDDEATLRRYIAAARLRAAL